jgi:hypothetical protein
LRRDEIIAAIEKLEGGAVHPQRMKDLEAILMAWNQRRLVKWNKSWTRRALLALMFGPLFVVIFTLRNVVRHSGPTISPWFIFVIPGSMIVFAWVYMRLKPVISGYELGMLRHCGECGYDLSGLESVLGDELWVGPTVCPECG